MNYFTLAECLNSSTEIRTSNGKLQTWFIETP